MKLFYCCNCNKDNKIIKKVINKKVIVKGVSFTVQIKQYFCKNCGGEIYYEPQEKINEKIIYDMYHKLTNDK